jgi:hypothetical protein
MPKPLSERHIQETCSEWLSFDGWRRIRTDPPWMRGLAVQEKGIADDLYIRYGKHEAHEWWNRAPADVLWIEWKKKGGNGAQHQLDWHQAERARGALTWIAGEDFPASIEGFQDWYRKSGLMRRNLR